MIQFFLKTVLLLTLYNFAFAEDELLRISKSPGWQKLLHYNSNGISFQDSPLFFAHSEGKKNAFLELQETIRKFKDPQAVIRIANYDFHPQCLWPARFYFLKKSLKSFNPPELQCKKFPEWAKGLKAKSVSLIFSTAYANNPASMFGHTFLRLNQSHLNEKRNDLLDYAITFSAHTGDQNGILYALMGLFGFYRGFYSVEPYYLKVREYNRYENRDLWEYGLKLNREEVDQLVRHLWELYATSYFDYYFFDENCSFHILGLLEAVKPEWDLTSKTSLFTAPNVTVIDLVEQGAVEEVKLRSSMRSRLKKRVLNFSREQEKTFSALIQRKTKVEKINDPYVVDGYLDYLNIRKVERHKHFSLADREHLHKSFIARSKLSSAESVKVLSKSNQPELGHRVSRFGIHHQNFQSRTTSFSYRLGFHDFLQNDFGYEPFSEVAGLELHVGFDQDQEKVILNRLNLIQVKSLHSFEYYDPDISWEMGTQLHKSYYGNFHHQESYFSTGLAKRFNRLAMFYALGGIRLDVSGDYRKGYLEYLRFHSGAILDLKFLKAHYELKLLNPIWNKRDYQKLLIHALSLGHSFKRWDFKIASEWVKSDQQGIKDTRFETSIGWLY